MSDSKKKDWGILLDKALDKASTVMKIGSEAADVLVHLQSPTTIGMTAVGLRVVDSVRKARAKSKIREREQTPRFGEGWRRLYTMDFTEQLYGALTEKYVIKKDDEALYDNEIDVECDAIYGMIEAEEFNFGCCIDEDGEIEEMWVEEKHDEKKVMEFLGRQLWENLKTNKVILTTYEDSPYIIPEPNVEIFPSKLGDEILERVDKFRKKGFSRSIFLIGEPGVGKSCLMRYAGSKVGGFSLRIKMGDLQHFDSRVVEDTVRLLRPDCILIDDFDRFAASSDTDSGYLLDTLEEMNKNVKLLMVSANYSEDITPALLRPGRFDEIIQVKTVDEAVIDKMLGDCPTNIKDKIKKMPISHIQEFAKRIEVLGYDEAFKELQALIYRQRYFIILNESKVKRRSKSARIPESKAATYAGRANQHRKKALRLEKKAIKMQSMAQTQRKRAEQEDAKAERAKERKRKKEESAGKKKSKKKSKKKADK